MIDDGTKCWVFAPRLGLDTGKGLSGKNGLLILEGNVDQGLQCWGAPTTCCSTRVATGPGLSRVAGGASKEADTHKALDTNGQGMRLLRRRDENLWC